MKLSQNILNEKKLLTELNIDLPNFDYQEIKENTLSTPKWIHFGAGNIFRAFLASAQQELLNSSIEDSGIIVVEGYDYEIVDKLKTYDNLTINVILKSDGEVKYEIVGSIAEYLKMDLNSRDYLHIKTLMQAPSLQMLSFTITEKGYALSDNKGEFFPNVIDDFKNGPEKATSYIGKLVALLYTRFKAGELPLALVSMDNMSKNGSKLEESVYIIAEQWMKNNFVPREFLTYLKDKKKISFPWTMIDKITPRPHHLVKEKLEELGFEGIAPSETSKNTFIAPFVNGEETEYLIIEDDFPNGRPKLDKTGILFTKRETVNAVETMKVTTCLNPLHTALAIFGCLLGHKTIDEEMKDADLVNLIKVLGYDEGLPVVNDPGIISPKEFIDEVINVRLPNPYIPDTPQRIASDTSQKLSVRFGHTLMKYVESTDLEVSNLKAIPLVYAGWLRYLMGINDQGEHFELSPDPLLEELKSIFNSISLGDDGTTNAEVISLLENEKIMGINLFESGIAETVLTHFKDMSSGVGAVRETLKNVIGNR